jgi:hypothetical protein
MNGFLEIYGTSIGVHRRQVAALRERDAEREFTASGKRFEAGEAKVYEARSREVYRGTRFGSGHSCRHHNENYTNDHQAQ